MKLRKGRTLFFVDIAVPRNVEPSVHGIDNVYVFNVDDLEKEVARGLKARHAERGAADKIVEEELARFLAWTRGLEVQPTVVAMRAKAHAVFFSELERSLGGRLKHLAEARSRGAQADARERGEQAAARADDASQGARRRRRRRARAGRRHALSLRSQELGGASAQLEGAAADSEGDERLPN